MKKALLIILAVILFIVPCIPWVSSIVKCVEFDSNCGDYLKLAADANTIDVAEKHLSKSIEYVEKKGLTSGYTKIFVYHPTNDLGLWYENLKTAQTQLQEMKESGYTELEQSNMLMKLRETLLNNEGGLTHPDGISLVPNFTLMFWLNCVLWLPCWFIGGIFIMFAMDDWY